MTIQPAQEITKGAASEASSYKGYIKALTDSAFSYALLLDPDAKILYFSDSLIKLAKIEDRAKFIGMSILDAYDKLFTDKDFISKAGSRLTRIISGEDEFHEDDVITWPTGEKLIYRITYKRVTGDGSDFDGIVIFSRDITDIRLEEANLRISDLMHSSVLPCAVWDEKGNLLVFNKKFSDTFDIPDGITEDRYNEIFGIIQPSRQASGGITENIRRKEIREAMDNGFSQSSVWLKKRGGIPFYCSVNITRIAWLFSFRLVVFYYDHTDAITKEAEANERTKLMLNSMPLSCTLWDEDFNCIDCNDEVIELFGVDDKQEYLDGFFDFSPEYQPDGRNTAEKAKEALEIAYREGRYVFDWMHHKRDGSPIPAEITLVRVKHGEKNVILGYTQDLREYQQLVRNQEESRTMMSKSLAILENVDALISVTDLDYTLVYMNQNMADAFKLDRDDCIGQKCYKVIRNKEEPCSMCRLPELLPNKDSLPILMDEYIWDDVLWIWTESKSSIIRWVDDSLVMFHSINDRSVKKAYEDELIVAMEASIAASASKTAFLANMSHEVRTPMNSIIGFAELALDGEIHRKTKEYLEKIVESAKWLLHIINDILDISKIESGKIELEKAPFNLENVIARCQSVITPAASEKGLELIIGAVPLLRKWLLGDSVRLYQVLMNLLANAVKFTNTGTVCLTLSEQSIDERSVTIRFEVTDSGIGMSPAQIERVFDSFVQADSSTTRTFGGTGLGLTITKRLVELMGGELKVDSALDIGSTFSFDIAFETSDTGDESPELSDITTVIKPHFNGQVLVCEDNSMNQQVICEHLMRVGLQPEVAENGKAGVEIVQERKEKGEKPFDLIFMDMYMPVMNGIEAALEISALNTGAPIVAMTANITTGELEEYRNNGMSDYVGKPFTSQELWRCLLKYLTPVGASSIETEASAESSGWLHDAELKMKLEASFALGSRNRHDELLAALAQNDVDLAFRLAHNLKTNAGLIGRTGLQDAAAKIELELKESRTPTLDMIQSLKTELDSALKELELRNGVYAPAAALPLKQSAPTGDEAGAEVDAKAAAILAKLEPLLKSRNPECLALLDEIRAIPGLGELASQIEKYDFKLASQTLAALMKERNEKGNQ